MRAPKETKAKLQNLKFALAQIRRQAEEALEQVEGLDGDLHPKFLHWKCDGCGHEKHFTRPSTIAACDSCPRCKGTEFSAGER